MHRGFSGRAGGIDRVQAMLQAKNGLRALAAPLTYAVTVTGRVDIEAIEQTLLAEVGPEAALNLTTTGPP